MAVLHSIMNSLWHPIMYYVWNQLRSSACLVDFLAIHPAWQNFSCWTLFWADVCVKFVILAMIYRCCEPLPFYATFSNLNIGQRFQGQLKSEPFGLIFLHTSWLEKVKFDVGLKRFMLNRLMLHWSKILWLKGNKCCSSGSIKKVGNVCTCSYVFNWLTLYLVWLRWYLSQYFDIGMSDLDFHSRPWCEKTSVPIILQYSILTLMGMNVLIESIYSDEPHLLFYLVRSVFKGENLTCEIS